MGQGKDEKKRGKGYRLEEIQTGQWGKCFGWKS